MQIYWDAFSAIGTVAAVVVALILALQAEFYSRGNEKRKAGLVAARLLESVRLVGEEVRHKMAAFAFYEDEQEGSNDNFACDMLTLRALADVLDIDTIEALSPLPGNCANRLAMAVGIIDALGREIEYVKSKKPWSKWSAEWRKNYVERWMSMSSRASDYFLAVIRELESSAGSIAPIPSGEELHGPWEE